MNSINSHEEIDKRTPFIEQLQQENRTEKSVFKGLYDEESNENQNDGLEEEKSNENDGLEDGESNEIQMTENDIVRLYNALLEQKENVEEEEESIESIDSDVEDDPPIQVDEDDESIEVDEDDESIEVIDITSDVEESETLNMELTDWILHQRHTLGYFDFTNNELGPKSKIMQAFREELRSKREKNDDDDDDDDMEKYNQ